MKKIINKIRISYKVILFSILLLFTGQSCKDALNEEVVSAIGNDYVNTPKGFEDAVTASYSYLRAYYGQEMGMTMSQMGTDTYTQGSDGSYKKYNLYSAELDGRDNWVNTLWAEFYKGINSCNVVIAKAASIEGVSDATIQTRIAEVKALRAHYYFILVQHFGGLDLRLEPVEGPVTAITRSTEEAVYTQIVKDYTEALADLPESSSDWGRYTKLSVEAMLCKVHITRATRSFAASDDFSKAELYGKNVINNYDRALVDDYADLWELGNDENSEAIFSVQFSYDLLSAGGYGNKWHLYYLMEYDTQPGLGRVLEVGRPWKRLRPTDYTYNQVMVNRDVDSRYNKSFRKVFYATKAGTFPTTLDNSKATITLAVGDTAIYMPGYEMSEAERATKPYQVYTPSMYQEKQYGVLAKFLDPLRASINETRGGRDFMITRLGEIYLLVAETLIKQNKSGEALPYINAIRTRAAFDGKEAEMELTEADVDMELIYDERARELSGEGYRWTDLKRWGNLVERVKKYNALATGVQEFHNYRPIPQDQIDLVDGGAANFPQNEGY